MKSKLLLFVIALAGVTLGYLAGGNNRENDAAAQSKPITTAYHIVYLSDPSVEHGKWTLEMAQAYGFQLLESWTEVRKVAEVHPLDALVAAQSKFAELTETDRTWLRSQIEEGLIIAGIGIDIEPFSAALGLPNLRNPGEARVPVGDDGYILFYALLLGTPQDMQLMREANWLEHSILGEPVKLDTPNVMIGHLGRSRGKLTNEQEIESFVQDLYGAIDYFDRVRAEMAGINKN